MILLINKNGSLRRCKQPSNVHNGKSSKVAHFYANEIWPHFMHMIMLDMLNRLIHVVKKTKTYPIQLYASNKSYIFHFFMSYGRYDVF